MKYKGIKTKIVHCSKGYWKLVIADKKQGHEIAIALNIELKSGVPRTHSKDIVLAIINYCDMDGKWEIKDWRRSFRYEALSAYLCASDLNYDFIDSEVFKTPEMQEKLKAFRELKFKTMEKNSDGSQQIVVNFPTFNGVYMIEERNDGAECYSSSSQWSYKEARSYLADLKEFWATFKGDSLLETKIENPFCQSELRVMIAEDRMERWTVGKLERLNSSD